MFDSLQNQVYFSTGFLEISKLTISLLKHWSVIRCRFQFTILWPVVFAVRQATEDAGRRARGMQVTPKVLAATLPGRKRANCPDV